MYIRNYPHGLKIPIKVHGSIMADKFTQPAPSLRRIVFQHRRTYFITGKETKNQKI